MEIKVGNYYQPPEKEDLEIDTSEEEDLFCGDFFREVEKRIKWDK
ncbi:hypothetical protein [Fusobacterium sp. HMSC073F01]|nr:hypothetical protein [Fusobacterium sp. HMSC073F01]